MNRKNDANNVQNGKIFSSTTPLQRGDEENYGLKTFQESLHNQYERSDNAGFGENEEGYKTNGANFNINYQIPENGDQSFDIISNNNNYSNIFESSITESQADTIVMGNDYGIVSDSENDTGDEKYYNESANDRKMEYDKNQVEIEVKLGKNAVPESRITPKKDEKDNYNDNKNINLIRQPNKFEEDEEAEAEAEEVDEENQVEDDSDVEEEEEEEEEEEAEAEEVDEENQVEDDNNVEEEEEEEEEGDENYAADEDQEQNYYDDEEFNSVDQDEKNNSIQNHSPQKTSKNGNEIENNNDSLTEKINNIEKSKNHEIYSSWSLPSDNVRRVQFATKIISDTFTIREKHSLFEIPTLFYTHDESIQFTNDYNRYVLVMFLSCTCHYQVLVINLLPLYLYLEIFSKYILSESRTVYYVLT